MVLVAPSVPSPGRPQLTLLCVPLPASTDPQPFGAMCSGRGGRGAQLRGFPGTERCPDRAGCGPEMRGGSGGDGTAAARALPSSPPSSFSSSLPPPPPGARSPSRERAAGGRMLQTAAEAGGWAGKAGGAGAAIRRGVGTAVARAKLWEEGMRREAPRSRAGFVPGSAPCSRRNAPLRCPSPSRPSPRRQGAGSAVPRGGRAGTQPQLRCPTRKTSDRKGNLFRGVRQEPRLQPFSSCCFRLSAGPRPAGCEASPGHGVPVCGHRARSVRPTRGRDRGRQLGLRAACRGGREPSGMAWPVRSRGCGRPSVLVTAWHSWAQPLRAAARGAGCDGARRGRRWARSRGSPQGCAGGSELLKRRIFPEGPQNAFCQ